MYICLDSGKSNLQFLSACHCGRVIKSLNTIHWKYEVRFNSGLEIREHEHVGSEAQ